MVSDRGLGSNWPVVLAAVGWTALAGPLHAQSQSGVESPKRPPAIDKMRPLELYAVHPKRAYIKGLQSGGCVGTDQPGLRCDAIAAQAAADQARDTHWQIYIGLMQAVGLIASLAFSARATRAAFRAVDEAKKGAQASKDSLDETRRMNSAAVRPHIAIETAAIQINEATSEPTIYLTTRNASSFTAHDWECQLLIKLRAAGTANERKSPLHRWGKRGVAGVDLPPGDYSPRIPMTLGYRLNPEEIAAVTSLDPGEGLLVTLAVFGRCFDIFGVQIPEKYNFSALVYNVLDGIGGGQFAFQRTPPGTQIEGEEDDIPHAPAERTLDAYVLDAFAT